ncbi:MAG: hypothetical protein ABI587_01705 [Gemmatimonadales bacterium]
MQQTRFVPGLILTLAAIMSAGCASNGPAAPNDLFEVDIATCAPSLADSISQIIGVGGGTIILGPQSLVVPAGALSSDVSIMMQILPDSASSVLLEPQGLTFAAGKPAILTLSIDQCIVPSPLLQSLNGSNHNHHNHHNHGHHHGHGGPPLPADMQVVYTTDALQILEVLPSVVDSVSGNVSAELSHFSRYAVAW